MTDKSDPRTARWFDLPLALVGVRSSIRRLTLARNAIWYSGALVCTAALAREYDAVSLLHRPYDLLGPFAASLILSTFLLGWVMAGLSAAGVRWDRPGRQAIVFLCGYWLTAPLAWLYAFPVEAFFGDLVSLRYNLAALSIVSVWRVLLFARIIAIQFRTSFAVCLFLILVPCMVVAFLGLLSSMMSLVSIMGGIRLTATQQVLLSYQQTVIVGLWWSFVPVVIASIASLVWLAKRTSRRVGAPMWPKISPPSWLVPAVACGVLLIASFQFQPLLYRAELVSLALLSDQPERAMALLSRSERSDFPAAWDPPPHFPHKGANPPPVVELVRAIGQSEVPLWAIDSLLIQADEILLEQHGWTQGSDGLSVEDGHFIYLSAEQLRELISDLDQILPLRTGDTELAASFEKIREVAVKSLEMELGRESFDQEGGANMEDQMMGSPSLQPNHPDQSQPD